MDVPECSTSSSTGGMWSISNRNNCPPENAARSSDSKHHIEIKLKTENLMKEVFDPLFGE